MEQSHAAHIVDDGVAAGELAETRRQVLAHAGGVADQVVIEQTLDGGFTDGAGDRVAAMRMSGQELDACLRLSPEDRGDLVSDQDAGERRIAAADALAESR